MGLFDWLKGARDHVELADDRIWLTQQAKLEGMQREVSHALADRKGPSAVIAVAHFSDCLEQLRAALAGLDRDRVLITRADVLSGRAPPSLVVDRSASTLIMVGERHPLLSHDDAIVDFARGMPCRCRMVWHLSLEDAVLRRFSGEWVTGVLRRLGMNEGEAIASQVVARRIRRALERFQRFATGDAPADSAEEWLERNCP